MKKSNICPICSGEKHNSTTTFSVDLGNSIVVVRHVPALVCEQCGEEWIYDSSAEQLEKIVSEAKRKQTTIEVSEFPIYDEKAS